MISTFLGLEWVAGEALITPIRRKALFALRRIFDRIGEVHPLSAHGSIGRNTRVRSGCNTRAKSGRSIPGRDIERGWACARSSQRLLMTMISVLR